MSRQLYTAAGFEYGRADRPRVENKAGWINLAARRREEAIEWSLRHGGNPLDYDIKEARAAAEAMRFRAGQLEQKLRDLRAEVAALDARNARLEARLARFGRR